MVNSTDLFLDYNSVLGHFKDAINKHDPNQEFSLPIWLQHPKNTGKK